MLVAVRMMDSGLSAEWSLYITGHTLRFTHLIHVGTVKISLLAYY